MDSELEREVQLDEDSDLGDVYEALIDIKHVWYYLGLQLGLGTKKLDGIKAQYPTQFETALLEMLKQWLKQTEKPRTWKAIVKALRQKSVNEEETARDIEKKYIVSKDCQPGDEAKSSISPAQCSVSVGEDIHPSKSDSHLEQQFSSDHSDDSDFEPKNYNTMEKYSYPCLNTNGMSESERSSLRGRLTNDYRRINSEYSRFSRSIRKSLRDREITPRQLAEVLMELNAFSLRVHDQNKPLLDARLDEIDKAESVNDVFKILHPYGSFFDCYIIKHIVRSHLCTDEDREKLKKYLEKLNEYCQRSIFECPHFATPEQDPKFRTLVMKMDEDISTSFTMKALEAFRDELATALHLEGHTLRLCSVEDGCFRLVFQIPNFVKVATFPLSNEQKEQLIKLQINRIECDGNQFIAQTPVSTQLSEESQPTSTQQQDDIITSTEVPQSARYCYIHHGGVVRQHGCFTFRSQQHNCDCMVMLPFTSTEDSGGLICEREVKSSYSIHPLPAESTLYTLLEVQDRALNRHLHVFLKEQYAEDICQKLLQYLKWLSGQRLTPKLEGRFGRLPWRHNADKSDVLSFNIDKFVDMAFDDPSSHFLAKVSKEDVGKLKEKCYEKGDIVDSIETYDFKLSSKIGKLDVRVKFNNSKPKIVMVKKFEFKVATFDVLCLNRQYDMRVSLNTYESASTENIIATKFVSTLSMPSPGSISFAPKAVDDEWTVAFIRHKRINTFFFQPHKYAVTLSNVGQLPVEAIDSSVITVKDTDYDFRSETELHNLSWEVAFGHQISLTPEESLVLFTERDSIPPQLHSYQGWTPDGVVKEFSKDGFLEMMEDINEIMSK